MFSYNSILKYVNNDNLKSAVIYQTITSAVKFIATVLLIFLNIFADNKSQNKKDFIKNDQSPELRSGFVNKIFYHWFDKLAHNGYKNSLNENNVWKLYKQNTSEIIVSKFEKYLPKYKLGEKVNN